MHFSLEIHQKSYTADLSQPVSLALPLQPDGKNPNCYYAEAPQAEVIRADNFVGSVAAGGTVNYQRLHLTPHGNGTHTECVGHITSEAIYLPDCLRDVFIPTQVISVQPQSRSGDQVIRKEDIAAQLSTPALPGLAVRTLPSTEDKAERQYSGSNPPYFDEDVGSYLAEIGVFHLLTDLPSVDKEADGGALRVHRGFWRYPEEVRLSATITELIFVPDFLSDGMYLLNLQVPRILLDAVPSQPVVFAVQPEVKKDTKRAKS